MKCRSVSRLGNATLYSSSKMTTPAMSPRDSFGVREPVSPRTATEGVSCDLGVGFWRIPLSQVQGKRGESPHCYDEASPRYSSQQGGDGSSSPSTVATKSTCTTPRNLHSRAESFELPPIPSSGNLYGNVLKGKSSTLKRGSVHHVAKAPSSPLFVTPAVSSRRSASELDESQCRKSAEEISDYRSTKSYDGTAAWVFDANNDETNDVYKSFVSFLDQHSPQFKASELLKRNLPDRENTEASLSIAKKGSSEEIPVVDELVSIPTTAHCSESTSPVENVTDALQSLAVESSKSEDLHAMKPSVVTTYPLEKMESKTEAENLKIDLPALKITGPDSSFEPSPFQGIAAPDVSDVGRRADDGKDDVFSFPVKSPTMQAHGTISAPLFGVGSWPSLRIGNASPSQSSAYGYCSTEEDDHFRHSLEMVHGSPYTSPRPSVSVAQTLKAKSSALPSGSPNIISRNESPRDGIFQANMYFYDEDYVDSMFEEITLRVVHRRGSTGFEYHRELPLRVNDLIAGRYQIVDLLGQAAFSRAVHALDLKTGQQVCLKVVKNDKDYFDQSLDEIKVLRYVNSRDLGDQFGVLRLFDFFYFKEHLILVTELLRANLYEFSRYDRENNVEPYFNPQNLKLIAKQMLTAVDFLHSLSLVHADLKPENILMKSYSECKIKIIDLGSSFFDNDPRASFVQSRSYRAPEVFLGLYYGSKIDIWSVGCILVELATGRVLFNEATPAQMLASMESVMGPFPKDMIVSGRNSKNYFMSDGKLIEKNTQTVCEAALQV